MHDSELLPWLTVRRADIERLERLATIVDDVSAEPNGLADLLRRTPTYRNARMASDRDSFRGMERTIAL